VDADARAAKPELSHLFALALWLGVAGFGGGWAIAQRVRRAVVHDRRWMDEDAFVETLSVSSSLPGTTSANLFTLLGFRFGGVPGALGAAAAFLAPSVAMMAALAAGYGVVRDVGPAGAMLDGMAVATVGVVAAVAVDMRAAAVRGRLAWALAIGSAAALATRTLNLLEVVAIAGLAGAIALRPPEPAPHEEPPPTSLRGVLTPGALGATGALLVGPVLALFLVFARIGVATFGGGIAMIAPIEHQVVGVHGWLGPRAFADAIVLGQITPGPVAISSTFIGWRVAGPLGAAAATLGMFGPPFVISVLAARSLPAFRTNAAVRGFLAGVAPAVVGAIAAAAVPLGRSALHAWWQALVAVAVFVLLVLRPRLAPVCPILAAGLIEIAARSW
jgi:chromate transporter